MTTEPTETEIDFPDPVYLDVSKIVVITKEDGSVLYAELRDGVEPNRRSPCSESSSQV